LRLLFRFYACSSVCRELSVKFVRFYKNAISRVILGKNFKKPLAIFVLKWYVVSNKSETWIHLHFGAANSAPHTPLFFTLLFSSFTFLSFTLPVPQGTRKAMTHLHGSSLFLLLRALRRSLPAPCKKSLGLLIFFGTPAGSCQNAP
jgi:hypothetical protein